MFAAGKTAAVSGAGPDAQFNYVTMLLHGDGTNGAQNNTFLDSSSNTFSITRNGNTTQGSFSPYGSNWSNFFDGTGDYLSVPSNAVFQFGTGDFTIECWFYDTGTSDQYPGIISSANGWQTGSTALRFNNTGLAAKFSFHHNPTGDPIFSSTNTFSSFQWYHVAVTRSGTSMKMFVNGVQEASATVSASISLDTTTGVYIGSGFDTSSKIKGYISNVRVVKGTAVYTSAFTPSTTPLTAISGTSLLTCQSNRFVDNSTTPFTITVNGNPSVQRFSPFGISTAYSTSVIGGSGYFDGSGDYLACGSQSAYAFGTGDFTINVWVYLTSAPTYMSIADTRNSGWALAIDANRAIYLYSDAVGFVVTSAVGAVPLNAWTYVTVKRVSGTMTLYLNAVSINSASNSTNFSNTTLAVGANTSGGEPFFGYICDFQAIKGTGTTPTLPTAPLTNVTNTSLLLNYQNGAIFDNAMMNDLETVGNAQISTSVKKYGTGSLAFDGSGDYLYIPNTLSLRLSSTGAFTIEFWVNPSALSSDQHVIHAYNNSSPNPGWAFGFGSGGVANTSLAFYDGGSWRTVSTGFSTGTWYHIAVSSQGSSNTGRLFLNGVQQGSAFSVSSSIANSATPIAIGAQYTGSFPFNGYIDDLRITNGYARYTANFTPPTSALSDTGPI
jgi:hypothetical protein